MIVILIPFSFSSRHSYCFSYSLLSVDDNYSGTYAEISKSLCASLNMGKLLLCVSYAILKLVYSVSNFGHRGYRYIISMSLELSLTTKK